MICWFHIEPHNKMGSVCLFPAINFFLVFIVLCSFHFCIAVATYKIFLYTLVFSHFLPVEITDNLRAPSTYAALPLKLPLELWSVFSLSRRTFLRPSMVLSLAAKRVLELLVFFRSYQSDQPHHRRLSFLLKHYNNLYIVQFKAKRHRWQFDLFQFFL